MVFWKYFAVACLFDLFVIALMVAYQHKWLPFRIVAFVISSACIAGIAAIFS